MARNAVSLHEFQPLAPKDTMLPGELNPTGFMAWERTWLFRVRDCYLVPWKLNDDEIHLEDIPAEAFDTAEERERVAAVLEVYNDDLTLTKEEDEVFAQLARERTARHPLRTYVWIPLRRAVRIWFTPRIELLPVSGHVFPLGYMSEEDPGGPARDDCNFLPECFLCGAGDLGRVEIVEVAEGESGGTVDGVLHRGANGVFDDAGNAGATVCAGMFSSVDRDGAAVFVRMKERV